MRKYESIMGIHKVSNKFFNEGDFIHVSEKIDGANASFKLTEDGVIHFYSRNNELLNGDTLRGFVPWCLDNLKKENLRVGYIYYGEWIVRHKIKYSEEIENTFMLFDVYSVKDEGYLTTRSVEIIANEIGVKTPKKLYEGFYISLEHLRQFVGFGEYCDKGEGIVIRNCSNYTKCKWVREDFIETKPVKQPKKQNPEILSLIESLLTKARVEKAIHKGLDENIYPDLSQTNYGHIMKHLGRYVIKDIIQEEKDVIPNKLEDEFVKIAKKKIPYIARQILDSIKMNS